MRRQKRWNIFNGDSGHKSICNSLETIFTKVNRAGNVTDGGEAGIKVSRIPLTAAEPAAAWSVWLTASPCPARQADGAVVSLLRTRRPL